MEKQAVQHDIEEKGLCAGIRRATELTGILANCFLGYIQRLPSDNEFTRILQWPAYRVYRHAIDEKNQILELWVRRKRGNRKLECSGCGRKFNDAYDCRERAVRDLPWSAFKTTVHIEVYRVKCCRSSENVVFCVFGRRSRHRRHHLRRRRNHPSIIGIKTFQRQIVW